MSLDRSVGDLSGNLRDVPLAVAVDHRVLFEPVRGIEDTRHPCEFLAEFALVEGYVVAPSGRTLERVDGVPQLRDGVALRGCVARSTTDRSPEDLADHRFDRDRAQAEGL